ncbi:MAG: hypothetical protein IT158_24055 [Bryobacterales bacterium]|nr:hypothetical protein [Bryobacterales bacterium]
MLTFIAQTNKQDCGLAAISSLTGQEYAVVRAALDRINPEAGRSEGTPAGEAIMVLQVLTGAAYREDRRGRGLKLSTCLRLDRGFLAGAGLVLLREPDKDCLHGHWSAFRAGCIMDPQTGTWPAAEYERRRRLVVCRVVAGERARKAWGGLRWGRPFCLGGSDA